jgi:hypothetical protein
MEQQLSDLHSLLSFGMGDVARRARSSVDIILLDLQNYYASFSLISSNRVVDVLFPDKHPFLDRDTLLMSCQRKGIPAQVGVAQNGRMG